MSARSSSFRRPRGRRQKQARRCLSGLLLLLAAACAGPLDDGAGLPQRTEGSALDLTAVPYPQLSQYNLLRWQAPTMEPLDGSFLYDLATPLFSDYALKLRTIWMPPGTRARWQTDEPFDFPVGTVITKTFAFPADFRSPERDLRVVETRLLVHHAEGWKAYPYVWDDAAQDAALSVVGATVDVAFTDAAGRSRSFRYQVPNANQCRGCHANLERDPEGIAEGAGNPSVMGLIGPRSRHLDRPFDQGGRNGNQLAGWAAAGWLEDLPEAAARPEPLVDWTDTSASLDARARAYLDINCAHCHNPRGPARVSGLFLATTVTRPAELGVCKSFVAAGRGGLGKTYDIVPGQPDESILLLRMDSDVPDIMMPELGRSLIHDEAVALIADWIAANPWADRWPDGCTDSGS